MGTHTPYPETSFQKIRTDYPSLLPGEWMINMSEFALQLSNQHLWLTEQDADWHRPLQCDMKVFWQRNAKFPSAYNETQVSRQSRFAGGQGSRGRDLSRAGGSKDTAEEPPPWKLRQIFSEQTGNSAGWDDWNRWQDRGPWSTSRRSRDQSHSGIIWSIIILRAD